MLVREGSKGRLEELRSRWGVDDERVVGIVGDLSQRRLGVSEEDIERLKGVDHVFHLAAIYDMTASAGVAACGQHRRHPAHGSVRRSGRGRPRPSRLLDRERRPLQGHLARGHVRRGREPRRRPLLPHQARLRGGRARRVRSPVARVPAGDRRRAFRDGRDGQGRRALLLLQADPAHPRHRPAVGADARHRGPADQHRPGGLRRRGDGPHRAPRTGRRPRVLPHGPESADRGRRDRHLRGRRACARSRACACPPR